MHLDPTQTPYLRPIHVCVLLRITPRTLARWKVTKKLLPEKAEDGSSRYRTSDVQRLLEQARHSTRRRSGPKPQAILVAAPDAILGTT